MKVLIDIPNYEFNNDVEDKFQDYFNRVKIDIANGTLCGNYELETTEMFLASFKRMQVLPDNATNGDMIKTMFPNIEADIIKTNTGGYIEVKYLDTTDKCDVTAFRKDWWNAPYKRGDSLVNGEDKKLDDSPFVEIGMCKDCKRYNKNEMFCTWHSGVLMQKCDPDYYCVNFEKER